MKYTSIDEPETFFAIPTSLFSTSELEILEVAATIELSFNSLLLNLII